MSIKIILLDHKIRTCCPTEDTTCSDEEEERNVDVRKEKKYLVFESCLLQLLKWCCNCGRKVKLNTYVRGTLSTVKGTCTEGHVPNWQSQPLFRDFGAGNLLLSAAILFCGLTFIRVAKMA